MISLRSAVASCCLALSTLTNGQAHHDHPHQPGVHQHGVGTLNLALDGHILEIELSGAADNFLGFEHQPVNDAQREQAQRALNHLRQPGNLFILPAEARCVADAVSIQSALLKAFEAGVAEPEHDHHHSREHEHDNRSGPSHQDITAHYRFRCDNPHAIEQVELGLFRTFPNTERLLLQSIGRHGQFGGEVTASQPTVKL